VAFSLQIISLPPIIMVSCGSEGVLTETTHIQRKNLQEKQLRVTELNYRSH